MNRKNEAALQEAIAEVSPSYQAIAVVRKVELFGHTITALEWAFELGRAEQALSPWLAARAKEAGQ